MYKDLLYLFYFSGAETPIYVALLAPNIKEPRGRMVSNKEIVDWEKSMAGQVYFKWNDAQNLALMHSTGSLQGLANDDLL